MGLFSNKQHQQPEPDAAAIEGDDFEREKLFFDEVYREELRSHGRWYFEQIISKNADVFKQDLDQTINEVKSEIKEHVATQIVEGTKQLNEDIKAHVMSTLEQQTAAYSHSLQESQEAALKTLTNSALALQQQHKTLADTLQKTVTDQTAMLTRTFEENNTRLTAMHDAQDSALQVLQQSVRTLQDQHEKMNELVGQALKAQEANLVRAFEENMAQIIEHYVVDALGDQFDLKAQLPSIIKQMEQNKDAIVSDMKL